MWFMYEKYQPNCKKCGKPMETFIEEANDYLEDEEGNLAEFYVSVPVLRCCGTTITTPQVELANVMAHAWTSEIDEYSVNA